MTRAHAARAVAFAPAMAAGDWPAPTPAVPTRTLHAPTRQRSRRGHCALRTRLVVTGIDRACGVRQVGRWAGRQFGRFCSGSPLSSKLELLLQTQAGRALGPQRSLVAVDQTLCAPLGHRSHAHGAGISIDPRRSNGACRQPARRGAAARRRRRDRAQQNLRPGRKRTESNRRIRLITLTGTTCTDLCAVRWAR